MSNFTASVLDPWQTSAPKPQKPREMFGGTFGGFDDVERTDLESPLDNGFKEPAQTEFKSGTIHFSKETLSLRNKAAVLEGTLTNTFKVAEKATDAVKEVSSVAIDLFLQDIFGIGSKNEQPQEKSPEIQQRQAEASFKKEAFRTQTEDSNRARMQKIEERQKDAERMGIGSLEESQMVADMDSKQESPAKAAKIGSGTRASILKLLEVGISTIMMAVKKIEWKTQNKRNANSAAGIASNRMSDLSLNKVAEGGSMLSSTGGNAG